MLEIAKRVGMPDVRCVFPAAAGNSWYPGRFMDPVDENEPWLTYALEAVGNALAALGADGFGPGRTALIGFSQGACLLAEYLVRYPRPFAAAVLLTGGYLGPDGPVRRAAVCRTRPGGTHSSNRLLLSSTGVPANVPAARRTGPSGPRYPPVRRTAAAKGRG